MQTIALTHTGATLEGAIFTPQGSSPHPAVMVMPGAMGRDAPHIEIARRLAAQGFVALTTDLYGGGASFTDYKQGSEVFRPVVTNPDLVRGRTIAWFDALRKHPGVDPTRVAAIGYCFGGHCVLELARGGADVKAVVAIHGPLKAQVPAAPGAITGRVAVYTGAKDPYAPRPDVDAFRAEMEHAGAAWHLTIFGDAYHAFTSERDAALPLEGLAYDPLADAVTWAGMVALLKHVLAVRN